MTARFTTDQPLADNDPSSTAGPWRQRQPFVKVWEAPLASAGSWPSRPSPGRLAKLEKIWRENMERRDTAAVEYGEPETPHEFYAGRPGSKAETIVLDCLRELKAIPEADRLYAYELTDAISAIYLDLAWDAPRRRDAVKIHRRTMALMRIAAGEKATHGL